MALERAAVRAESLDAGFERVCRIAARGLGVARAVLWTRYGELSVRASHGTAGAGDGPRLSDAIARGVVDNELSRTVQVDTDSAGLAGFPRDFSSGHFVPVRAGEHVVGCLGALSVEPRIWADDERALLADLAEVAGQAVADWVHWERREAGWLRERADDLAIMFRSARMGTLDWNVRTDSLVFSGQFDEYLSARRGGFAGGLREWLGRVHADDRERVDRALQQSVASGEPLRTRFRFSEDDGRTVSWFEVQAHVVLGTGGVPERVLGVCFDLSARQAVPADSEGTTGILHRFNVLDAIRDAVLLSEAEPVADPGPRVIAVNEAFTRMTGYTAADIVGRTPRILQGEATERDVLERIRRSLEAWKPMRCRLTNYRKSGERFLVELDIVPIADSSGWFTHWVSVQREVLAGHA